MASVYLRIRQVKPEIWRNSVLVKLGPAISMFYIGLWMVADDYGVLSWKPDQIAALLYMYQPVRSREKFVLESFDKLAKAEPGVYGPMVELLPCGRHARIPALPSHQNIASTRRSSQHIREHNEQCTHNGAPVLPIADTPIQQRAPMSGNGNGNGNEKKRGNAVALQPKGKSNTIHDGHHGPTCSVCAVILNAR